MANIGQLIPLPAETRSRKKFSHILRLTYLDVLQLTSGAGQAVIPSQALAASSLTLPAGTLVHRALARCITPFVGPSTTGMTFSLGDGGSATRFVNAFQVVSGSPTGKGVVVASGYHYDAADTIDATFTITGGTMAGLTAGQVDVYLDLVDTADLASIVQPSAT